VQAIYQFSHASLRNLALLWLTIFAKPNLLILGFQVGFFAPLERAAASASVFEYMLCCVLLAWFGKGSCDIKSFLTATG